MKSGFHDPIAPKEQKPKALPNDGKKSPWDFTCPDYDQRTSSFVNAGSHHGVGHKAPVGHLEQPKSKVVTLPFGHHKTMRDDEKG